MSTAQVSSTILQGATYRQAWRRGSYPYAVKLQSGKLVRQDSGRPVLDADFTPVDYTGCTARMHIRSDVLSPDVLLEFSTESGDPAKGLVELSADGWCVLHLSALQTAALKGNWKTAIGHLEVVYADGTVHREYEIRFDLSPEVTR